MKHYLQNDSIKGIKKLIENYEMSLSSNQFSEFNENDFLQIADFYDLESFPNEAMISIQHGIAAYPQSCILLKQMIRLMMQQNHPSLALEILEKDKTEILSPSDLDLLNAEALVIQGRYNKALSKLEKMKRKYQKPIVRSDIYVLMSFIFEKQNNTESALEAINQALHYTPSHKNALRRVLYFLEFTKRHKENIRFQKQLLQKEHYSALTWYNLGISFYHQFMYEEAAEAFEFAYIIDSELDPAYYYCAEMYMLRGIYTEAIKVYDQMLDKFHVTKPEVYINLATSHIKTGSPNMALGYLKFAFILDEDPQILFLLAEAHRNKKNYDKAFHYYFETLELDETREDVHLSLALLYFERFDFLKASEHFEIAVEQAPEISSYWISYASLFMNIGEIEKAEAILNEGKEQNYCPQILFCQAACLMMMGKKKLGLHIMDEALNLDINQQGLIFEFAGELENDKDVNAILQYYNGE